MNEVAIGIAESVEAAENEGQLSIGAAVFGISEASGDGIGADVELVGSAANWAGLAIEDLVFEPLAASRAVLDANRRDAIIIDVGAQSTGVVATTNGAPTMTVGVPIAGDHFTRDLAHGLGLSYEDAERVKVSFGSDSHKTVHPGSPRGHGLEVDQQAVDRILTARAEELFLLIRDSLEQVATTGEACRIILTGGGSNLGVLRRTGEHVIGLPARVGMPQGIRDWHERLRGPAWSTAAGLAICSARI